MSNIYIYKHLVIWMVSFHCSWLSNIAKILEKFPFFKSRTLVKRLKKSFKGKMKTKAFKSPSRSLAWTVIFYFYIFYIGKRNKFIADMKDIPINMTKWNYSFKPVRLIKINNNKEYAALFIVLMRTVLL